MTTSSLTTSVGVVPIYESQTGEVCVFVCARCGHPLTGPTAICTSAMHVGTDRSGIAGAVSSSALALAVRESGLRL